MENGTAALDIKVITKRLSDSVAGCSSEEDLRISMEIVLREVLPELPQPKYEQAIKTSTFAGHADAVHQRLVIEYKKPHILRSTKKREEAIGQVYEYLTGLALGEKGEAQKAADRTLFDLEEISYAQDEEERLAGHVGIATDGETLVFIQRRAKKWHKDIERLTEETVEKLILWLRATSRKDLSPENLITDFGPESPLAVQIVGVLAELVHSGKHPKANVIYDEWCRIFGIVYGTEQLQRTHRGPESKALSAAYRVEGMAFPTVLFAIHTYYALLMKMLATEVIIGRGGLGDTFIGNLTKQRLGQELSALESGEVLQRQNIRNAIEQDFFGWYTDAWCDNLEGVLWKMAQRLLAYDMGTFELKPERTRDLLKDLYHGLIPEAVRHALGEYYTPDWLAEHTITLAGYDGDPHKTFLDPSCGSGTFLVMAIQRIRQWLSDRSVEWGSNEKRREAMDLIRHNVVGFDLNPLAVIASRTNYLFALGPLLRYRSSSQDFEIPVYLTDSVLLPGKTSQEQSLFAQETVPFPMTVGTFEIPKQVVQTRQVPDLMNLLHQSIADGHSHDSFVNRSIKQLGLTDEGPMKFALGTLFDKMAKLDGEGKNRVWARLIRNRYASLFYDRYFDFVVGNPPHVNWESLTPDWRKVAEGVYRHYGLFTLKGLESRHGGGKKDIATLFTYAVMDHFVKDGGVLALVVHVSLFKTSGAGEGYRRFQLGDGEHFAVEAAHDFSSFQPFQTHPRMKIKTRTVTFCALKNKKMKYPVAYTVWAKTAKGFIPGGLTWAEAEKRLSCRSFSATPLRGTTGKGRLSPWLTIPARQYALCKKVIATPDYVPCYQGHAGVYSGGLNGVYFVEIVERYPNGTVLIRNMHDVGKIKCPQVQMVVEEDLLFPLIRGRSVAQWKYEPCGHIFLVQDPATQRGYREEWMQQTHPLTWAYFKKFEDQLRTRKAFLKFYDPGKDPFYSMYDVGDYTMAANKVAWMDVSATMKATAIVSSGLEMPMPEHKVMFLVTETAEEAYYVTAVLNSQIVNTIISGYVVDNCISTHPVENIVVPKFDRGNKTHAHLAQLSQAAHDAAKSGESKKLSAIEKTINKEVEALW